MADTDRYDGKYAEFADILRFLESHVHRTGWRQPQMIYRVRQLPTGDLDDVAVTQYEASGHALSPDLGSSPVQALRTLAVLLESPLAVVGLAMMDEATNTPPDGHVFIGEALHNENAADIATFRERSRSDVTVDDLTQLPHTVLARYCLGIVASSPDQSNALGFYRRQDTNKIRWINAEALKNNGDDPANSALMAQLIRLHRADIMACRRAHGGA